VDSTESASTLSTDAQPDIEIRPGSKKEDPAAAKPVTLQADGSWTGEIDGIKYVMREALAKERRNAHRAAMETDPRDPLLTENMRIVATVAHRTLNGKEEPILFEELDNRDETWVTEVIGLYYRGVAEKFQLRKNLLRKSGTQPAKPAEISASPSVPA
jgi:hypothetical protein